MSLFNKLTNDETRPPMPETYEFISNTIDEAGKEATRMMNICESDKTKLSTLEKGTPEYEEQASVTKSTIYLSSLASLHYLTLMSILGCLVRDTETIRSIIELHERGEIDTTTSDM